MPRLAPKPEVIYEAVAIAFNTERETIERDSKRRETAEPKAVCMWLMKELGYKVPEVMGYTGYTKREMNRRIEHARDLMGNNEDFNLKVWIAIGILANERFKAIDLSKLPPLKRGVSVTPTSAQPIRLFQ